MDEKSIDPNKIPINNSSPPNQMRAILTTNGFIKIVLSDEPLSDIKQKFLSKEACSSNVLNDSKVSAEKNSQESINLKKVTQNDSNNFSEFKQTPRHIFMSTICHVRFKRFF